MIIQKIKMWFNIRRLRKETKLYLEELNKLKVDSDADYDDIRARIKALIDMMVGLGVDVSDLVEGPLERFGQPGPGGTLVKRPQGSKRL